MIKKILLGSFILSIILFSTQSIYSGVKAQEDAPGLGAENSFTVTGQKGSTSTVTTKSFPEGHEFEGSLAVNYDISIAKSLLDARNFGGLGAPYDWVKIYANPLPGTEGSTQVVAVIPKDQFTETGGFYTYSFEELDELPEGEFSINVVRATTVNAAGNNIGLNGFLYADAQDTFESAPDPTPDSTVDWGVPPSGGDPVTGGNGNPGGGAPGTGPVPPISAAGIGGLVGSFYKFILPIAIVIGLIKLLIALIGMATSSGDPQKVAQAKEEIYAVLMGLLVIGGAVTLIQILGNALGA